MKKKLYKIIEIAETGDKISLYYDRFMLICIVCSIIPLCFRQTTALFILVDRITVTIFIVDYFLRWITADIKLQETKALAFLKYPFTPFAIIDLLSILPSVTVLNSGFRLFRLLRLNKAFRTFKLLRYSKSFNLITSVIKKEGEALISVCLFALGYVLLCALIMFQVEPRSFDTFFDAIYWAVTTLTTVGYGDIYPTSDLGRVISMISSFVGIAVVALPTGIITAGYMDELSRKD